MKIAIGNDHSAVDFKLELINYLESKGISVLNLGTNDTNSIDYPDIAKLVSEKVLKKEVDFAILICGTGIGISIAANKIKGIRAALISNEFSAKMSKMHNNANIIAFGARVIGIELAKSCIDAYINTNFEGGRHENRVNKIEVLNEHI